MRNCTGSGVCWAAAAWLALTASALGAPPQESVVVIERAPSTALAEEVVERVGGRVARRLPLVGGFSAQVPASAVPGLRREPSILTLSPDRAIEMSSLPTTDLSEFDQRAPDLIWQPLIKLDDVPAPYDGRGVTVAMIDTGVTQVPDLGGRVVARVDFTEDADGIDHYGHGTHIAGVIAGDGSASGGAWTGAAPGASLVSVKVAGWNGATDVSTVIAAIQWVVTNRSRYGIRVLNLSFGTDGTQSYLTDPLDRAVERAMDAGILVVVAAGNRGPGAGSIATPGDDPRVLTVGAFDNAGTLITDDDGIPDFSSRGPTRDAITKPEIVAPGVSIVSSAAPGTPIFEFHPGARLAGGYFKGTGTSQAAAIVSGVAARVIQADPSLSPDRVKAILVDTANDNLEGRPGAGVGSVNARDALRAILRREPVRVHFPPRTPATGLGQIEGSRGSAQVLADPDGDGIAQLVTGEVDALGNRFDAQAAASGAWTSATWARSPWARFVVEAQGWAAMPRPAATWRGVGPDAESWAARNWVAAGWNARNWVARNWVAGLWG